MKIILLNDKILSGLATNLGILREFDAQARCH